MKNDLLLSDKDRLIEWLKKRRYVRTSEILKWGCENFSNRSGRNKQELCQEGFLRRLSEEEKYRLFGRSKESVYEVMDHA